MIRSTVLPTLVVACLVATTASAQGPKPAKPMAAAVTTPKPPKVKEASPGLLKQAKITPAAAEQTAMAQVAGGSVTTRKIEKDKGVLVYAFGLKVPGQEGYQEVHVDATTGAVASNTHVSASADMKVKPTKPTKKPPA